MSLLRRILKIVGIILGVVILLIIGLVVYIQLRWDASVDRPLRPVTASNDSATLARGKYLYTTSFGCWQCHGNEHDPNEPPAGGTKFDLGPMGVLYTPNITPDVETGIGNWTDAELVRVIREGVRKDGKVLFPVMPVDPLHGLSDNDVLAIVAYLRTLPPVKKERTPNEFSFLTKALMTFGAIGPTPEITEPVQAPPRALNVAYGEYVAKHASLCVDCHTPRDLQTGKFFYDSTSAGSSFEFEWFNNPTFSVFAPNITPHPETGIGSWTEEQFLKFMRTGMRPDDMVRSNMMPYAYYGLWDSLELRAVYQYLRTLPAIERTVPPIKMKGDALSDEPLTKGRGLFNTYCVNCHGSEGKGAPPTNIVMAEVTASMSDQELQDFIRNGQENLRMPAFGKTLSDEQLSAVVRYIRSWQK